MDVLGLSNLYIYISVYNNEKEMNIVNFLLAVSLLYYISFTHL